MRAAGLSLALLVAAAWASLRLQSARPAPAPRPEGMGAAAAVALLGGFRGLYADLLWYRAEGRLVQHPAVLYDLASLYQAIGRLQPHYPSMWYYTASRMAIDAPAHALARTPDGDWLWTRRGLDHLSEGIRLNEGHPDCGKLRFHLAELYHRRCTPRPVNRLIPSGTEIHARLKAERGEDAYERVVALVHAYRDDPGILPAWIAKSGHALSEAAVTATDPREEDRLLAAAEEEWRWLCRFYEDPSPKNRWLKEDPERFRVRVPEIRREFLDVLARQRSALAASDPVLWGELLRERLLNTGSPDLLAARHLRQMGLYPEALEAVAGEIEGWPPADPDMQERRTALAKAIREAARREREGKGDA